MADYSHILEGPHGPQKVTIRRCRESEVRLTAPLNVTYVWENECPYDMLPLDWMAKQLLPETKFVFYVSEY